MKSIKKVYPDRTEWRNEKGELHREDGPAIEHGDGTKSWYHNNQLHRENGPAIECPNGDKFWYQNDEFHREDGPAIEDAYGYKAWYLHGKRINCSSQEQFEKLMKLKAFW